MIVVLSDLHMGMEGAPQPRALEPLFEGATKVILNGDTTELSSERLSQRSEEQMQLLRATIQQAGADAVLISGNHDPDISQELSVTLNDGAIFITHGHAFHPMIVPWSSYAHAVRDFRNKVWEGHPTRPPLDRALLAAAAAARFERTLEEAVSPAAELLSLALHPWRSFQVIGYWRIFPELAVRFRDEFAPSARVVVSGHSHRAGSWWLRGCLVLNTGCFTFPGTPHAVLIEEDEVVLVPLQRVRGAWRYRAEARKRWRMGEIAAAAAAASTPVL